VWTTNFCEGREKVVGVTAAATPSLLEKDNNNFDESIPTLSIKQNNLMNIIKHFRF
jgi:hypothetical protein